MIEVKNLYSSRADERRRQFNKLINSCNMVLMNNIPEVDPSVWENFDGRHPGDNEYRERALELRHELEFERISTTELLEIDEIASDLGIKVTDEMTASDTLDEIENYQSYNEVCQWFAVGDSDADFLKRHGQYITYSDMLDTYFLAICHLGTSWDYVESMVEAFNDCYHDLEYFKDEAR